MGDQQNPAIKDDFFAKVKLYYCDIFNTFILKIVLWTLLIFHGGIGLVQTYFMMYVFGSREFASYGPLFFASFFALGGVVTILFKQHAYSRLPEELDMWKIDPEMYRSIKTEVRVINFVMEIFFWLSMLAGCLTILPTSIDYQRFFFIKLVRDHCPKCSTFLTYLYKLTMPMMVHSGIAPCVMFMYCTCHVRYQLIMLNRHTRRLLDRGRNESDLENLPINETFQREIRTKMIFCVKRQVLFLRLCKKIENELAAVFGFYALAGCAVGISVILFTMMFWDVIFHETIMMIRMTVLGVLVGFYFAILFLSGQALENEIDQISETVSDIEWYFLDAPNQKLYLIVLINSMQSYRVKFLSHSINFQLGVDVGKQIYAVGSVLINMKSRFVNNNNNLAN